jgi:hypothetical protein
MASDRKPTQRVRLPRYERPVRFGPFLIQTGRRSPTAAPCHGAVILRIADIARLALFDDRFRVERHLVQAEALRMLRASIKSRGPTSYQPAGGVQSAAGA